MTAPSLIATAQEDRVTVGEWVSGIPAWFGDFFGAIPEALTALYEFGDPSGIGQGWWGFVILLIWGVGLTAVPLYVARRTQGEHEWVSATMGTIAGFSVVWWAFGILPSAWIYFLDGTQELLEGTVIPASVGYTFSDGYRLDLMSDFYLVVRDSVVVLIHVVVFVFLVSAARRVQERYPRGLADGEVKPDPGGYR